MQTSILVTNDDGITSLGLALLVEMASELGSVTVVAPDRNRDSSGHSTSTSSLIGIKKVTYPGSQNAYVCNGTPIDCVKVGLGYILDKPPSIVLSGINRGENSSIRTWCSGTVNAACAAALAGITAVAFSSEELLESGIRMHWIIISNFLRKLISSSMPFGLYFSINLPALPKPGGARLVACRSADGKWSEKMSLVLDAPEFTYLRLQGDVEYTSTGQETTDVSVLADGDISVTPLSTNTTEVHSLAFLENLLEQTEQ